MSSHQANIHYGRGSNANAIHFYQLIQPHELQDAELKIRRSFVERYWKGVSNPISLKLPNGCEWKMFWEKRGEDIWLRKKHWNNFSRSLRSGDQLVFKYKGESHFEIIIFDDSALEIDYSSIRSCNNADEEEDNAQQQQKEQEEENDDDDDDCVEIIVNESQKPSEPEFHQVSREEEIKSCEEEHKRSSNPHNLRKRKINMDSDDDATHQNVLGVNNSNSGGTVKKCSKTETFKEAACDSLSDEIPTFSLKLSRTYAEGYRLRIPCWFSRKYRSTLEGNTASISCVGEERVYKVTLRLDPSNGSFVIYATGWKSFCQEHKLQVGDVCKFEMAKRKPVAFVITITRARHEPPPEQFRGSEQHEPNQLHQDKLEKFPVDKSRSCKETQDSDKQNKFLVNVSSLLKLSVPMEFIKRYNICNGNSVELKVGEQSWLVKVRHFPKLDFWRFSEGWLEFVSGCNLKIGDNCLFEMIDEENLVFRVSIVPDV